MSQARHSSNAVHHHHHHSVPQVESMLPVLPSKVNWLAAAGTLVVFGVFMNLGMSAAEHTVAYIEGNDIWRPEDDDD